MMIATLPPARSEDRSTPHWLPDTEPLTPAGNPSNKEKRHLGVSSTKFGALMIYPQKDFNQKNITSHKKTMPRQSISSMGK